MPNWGRKHCLFVEECEPLNLKQGLYCAFHHHPDQDQWRVIARKAQIVVSRARKLWAESQPHMPTVDEFARLIAVTKRYDLLDLWMRDTRLDDAVIAVPKSQGRTEQHVLDCILDGQELDGQIAGEVREALRGDHRIDPAEAARLRPVIRKRLQRTADLDKTLEEIELRARFPRAAGE